MLTPVKSREYPAEMAHPSALTLSLTGRRSFMPVGHFFNRAVLTLLVVLAASWLAGCWTPPNANRQPSGPPRIIANRVRVKSVMAPAIVQSVDSASRTIALRNAGSSESRAYHVAPEVSSLAQISVGTQVCATATEELSIYVSVDGRFPGTDPSLASPAPQARVRSIDRSYRLLGVQRIGGDVETFKVDGTVPLERMQAGDYVRIAPLDLVSLSKCREKR